jgi:hypothetical protein
MSYEKMKAKALEQGAVLKRKTGKAKVKGLLIKESLSPAVDRRGLDKDALTQMGINAVAEFLGLTPVENQEYDLKFGKVKISVHTQSTNLNEMAGPMNGWVKDPDVDLNQDCDIFVFTRINPSTMDTFIAGWITKSKFYDLASHYVAGERIGCVTTHDAGYTVFYEALTPMANLNDTMTMAPRRQAAWSKAILEKSRRGQ